MSTPQQILLVEDDAPLAEMMTEFLTQEDYHVSCFMDGDSAFQALDTSHYDLAIFDLMLPGRDGLELSRQLRKTSDCPILILTAKDDDMVAAASLQLGVDNYLQKPIRPHLLLAHIHALLRRVQNGSATPENRLQVDLHTYEAHLDGQRLNLTSGEYQLLAYLYERHGDIVPREQLYQDIRGIPFDGLDRSIDLRISTLRKKLGDESAPYRHIKTIRGKGYLLALN